MSTEDHDDALEWAKDKDWYRDMCRCGGDMPGLCFGPQNCPLCQDDEDEENEDE